MGRKQVFSDEVLIEAMTARYEKYGFANVTAVAEELGMHRVYLSQRITALAKQHKISPQTLRLWRSAGSRAQAARINGARSNRQVNITLTPENYAWLKAHKSSISQMINGLVTKAREEK